MNVLTLCEMSALPQPGKGLMWCVNPVVPSWAMLKATNLSSL